MHFKKSRKTLSLDSIINPLEENVPVLALVGHTNVGKSTLFNYLTKQNSALAADVEHLTRDRQYGYGRLVQEKSYIVIDTGGLHPSNESIQASVQTQIDNALKDTTHIGIVIDAIQGITHEDRDTIRYFRTLNKPLFLIANKSEKTKIQQTLLHESLAMGFSQCYFLSAKQKQGGIALIKDLLKSFVPLKALEPIPPCNTIQIAVIGRPNAGKSTLLNQILGEKRHIVSSEPGTTRNSISTYYTWKKEHYSLVDTAGIRRRTKIETGIESASVEQSLQVLHTSHVIILLVDATLGMTDQEINLLGRIREAGRGLLILINKWDLISHENKKAIQDDLKERLRFFPFVKISYVSALNNLGVHKIFPLVKEVHNHSTKKYSTGQLTRILQSAILQNPLPVIKRRTIKLRYAHPGGYHPLTIVIHGSNTQHLLANYIRYLEKFFYQQLKIVGTPLRLILKERHSN